MSAIAGLLRFNGSPVRHDVRQMAARLAHRGLDRSDVWAEAGVGIAHPVCARDGALVLVADARIDNRDDLGRILGVSRAESRAWSDAQWILHAYERWQDQTPEHLLGDFAFAVWDSRRHVLFCARDHLGVRPFYYCHVPGRMFAFASEIKGLLALSDVAAHINATRVADYLVPLLEDPAITFYDGIVRLPPAHRLMVSADRAALERYWALDPEGDQAPASDAACEEGFRAIFTTAVRDRMRSPRRVGALLSGGLDSSSIVCVARSLLPASERLATFSAVFPKVPSMDERAFMDAVVQSGGCDPTFVRGDQLSPLTSVDAMLEAEDEPFYAPNLYMHWALYGSAAAAGVGVMLDGFDGDTTVSHGLLRLTELTRAGRWGAAFRQARAVAPRLGVSTWRLLRAHCLAPILPRPARRAWRGLRDAFAVRRHRVELVAPPLAKRVGLAERLRVLLAPRAERPLTVRADQYRQFSSGLLPFVLEVADRAAASFGIEPRFPFFDIRLVSFCLALPADQKLRDGWTRSIERRAMEGILPAAVQWRRDKTNLFPHFIAALVRSERALLDHIVGGAAPQLDAYVDRAVLRAAYARYLTNPTEDDALAIWRAATLALWLERRERPTTHTGGTFHDHRQHHAARRTEAAV